jgi:thiosulfate reductase/polysulfide reductase chain A
MNRRGFLKLATTGAVGASILELESCKSPTKESDAKSGAPDRVEIASTCDMCVNKCSLIAVVERGIVKKLNPNPENPKSRGMLCARGNAGIQQLYDPARIKCPMIRAGERGEGKWKSVSWDEALDYTAQNLRAVKEKYGPEGTLWSSSEGFQEEFFRNLSQAFGSPNTVRHSTTCLSSVNLAYSLTFGTVPGFDVQNARYIIMSGANRLESFISPDTMALVDATTNRKAKLIYLDPRFTKTASKADEWYPIRPGTDAAFILAMLNVIIAENHYNKDFVSTHCYGFDQLVEHVKQYPPEWAAEETQIPTKDIQRIAREFADAAPRAFYYAGRRSTWSRHDFSMRHAQAILNAIIGSWDRQGGMVPAAKIELGELLYLPWDDPKASRVDEIEKNFPLAATKDGVYLKLRENVLAGKPYPVTAWMIYKQDPMNAVPEQGKTLQMLRQMDFVGVIDIQMSDTAWYADVILPESTYLERLDPIEMQAGIRPVVLLRQPVVKPLHDTKPCLEIVQGLAKRLGLSDYFDYTIEKWIAEQAKTLPMELPLEYLKKHGVYSPPEFPKYGTTLTSDHRFITKSGKIDLYSDRLKDAGYDPLPVYHPPTKIPDGQFRLVLGRHAFYTHANNTNYPWLNSFSPENTVWLHPKPACSLGINSGDFVEVASSVGAIKLKAQVTPKIHPDCVFLQHGFGKRSSWQRLATSGGSDAEILETAWDKVSGGAAMHETFVKVRRL